MTRPVQTVTVSSEGPAAEMFPDSMGQYDIMKDIYRYDRAVYKHVDRENRFIICAGKITIRFSIVTVAILTMSKAEQTLFVLLYTFLFLLPNDRPCDF